MRGSSFWYRIELLGRLPGNTLWGRSAARASPLHAGGLQLGARLGLAAALHQRLGLRQEIRQQQGVVLANRVVGFHRGEKIARHQLGPLMQQLIEGVLAVGAGLAPDHRAGLVVHDLAVAGDPLAVGLHVALLEVGWEARQVLVVGQNGVGLGAEEVVVPDPEQRQRDRQVLVERRGPEVLVHLVRAFQQGTEVLKADAERDGQSNGRPERVAAADPIPEHEHVLRWRCRTW